MNYTIQASQRTPALIIYLIDISASMNMVLENRRRIDVVYDALSLAIRQMVFRSTKGNRLTPRYRIAILAYSDDVYDLLNGIKGIDEIAAVGSLPDLTPRTVFRFCEGFPAGGKDSTGRNSKYAGLSCATCMPHDRWGSHRWRSRAHCEKNHGHECT